MLVFYFTTNHITSRWASKVQDEDLGGRKEDGCNTVALCTLV